MFAFREMEERYVVPSFRKKFRKLMHLEHDFAAVIHLMNKKDPQLNTVIPGRRKDQPHPERTLFA